MNSEDVIRMARENDWRPSQQRAALEIYDAAFAATEGASS